MHRCSMHELPTQIILLGQWMRKAGLLVVDI
jgi:hypothetical protein